MKPCKHLDYDITKYPSCQLVELAGFSIPIKYWERKDVPYEGAAVKVQFCKKRGRIDGISACYTGDLHCYEPEES